MVKNFKINRRLIKDLIKSCFSDLRRKDPVFAKRVFSRDIDEYIDRLIQYGFFGFGTVLDAGCGFGQWTISLSILNNKVEACDISNSRVQFLKKLLKKIRINNTRVHCCNLSALPYSDESFDAIFCYGVIFLTDWRRTLRELTRVLRPTGKIYLNANGFGWYKHLWYEQPNKTPDYDPRSIVAKTFLNTWNYYNNKQPEIGTDIIIEPEEMRKELEILGFSQIKIAPEGKIRINRQNLTKPFFKGKYSGDLGVYEIVAKKRTKNVI